MIISFLLLSRYLFSELTNKMGKFKESLGINELKDKKGNIWKALLAEFLGNLLLNFFGCAPVVVFGVNSDSYVGVALAFGLTIFIVVQVILCKYKL